MKFFRNIILISLLGLLYSSCAKKENYPDVPVISYNSFNYYTSVPPTSDSAILTINFTDGNGDIGYPSGETEAPPDLYITPLIYYYTTKTYRPVPTTNGDTVPYSYTIPTITPTGNDKELSGLIKINMGNFIYINIDQVFLKDTILKDTMADPTMMKFRVWMFDRAGNKSNVLITPVQNVPE